MLTHGPTRANAIALTLSTLLGLGALAGCSGSGGGPAPAATTAPASQSGSPAQPSSVASAGLAQGAPIPATQVGKSAPALLSGAQAALRDGHSVHIDITDRSSQGSITYSDDAAASGGRQVITIDGAGHVTILFVAGVGYVQADAGGLVDLFEVPQSQADKFADQWIALKSGEKLGASSYDDVTAGITLASVASELQLTGTPSLSAPTSVGGQRVVGVQASMPASAQLPAAARDVLYMTDNSLLRPVLSEVTNAGGYEYRMSFSQWGEAVNLTAPANAIPASSLTQSTSIA
jgi:hypothetical protein